MSPLTYYNATSDLRLHIGHKWITWAQKHGSQRVGVALNKSYQSPVGFPCVLSLFPQNSETHNFQYHSFQMNYEVNVNDTFLKFYGCK